MRFLANENFPLTSVVRLREAGHDVCSVAEDGPSSTDVEVLQRCRSEQRVLLTFDRDYGELIYHDRLAAPAGVIYLRFDPISPEEPAEIILLGLLIGSVPIEGQFTVLQRDHIRQRPLPT